MIGFRTLHGELSALATIALGMSLRPMLDDGALDRHATHRTPVVLVHGLLGDWSNFRVLQRLLAKRGVGNFASFSYGPRIDHQRLAVRLGRLIEAVCRESGSDEVDVVGHSLGGLIARYLVEMSDERRVRRLVTLGSPYYGRGFPPNELAIFAQEDLLIPLPDAARTGSSNVIVVPGCGHLGLLCHRAVLEQVVSHLTSPTTRFASSSITRAAA